MSKDTNSETKKNLATGASTAAGATIGAIIGSVVAPATAEAAEVVAVEPASPAQPAPHHQPAPQPAPAPVHEAPAASADHAPTTPHTEQTHVQPQPVQPETPVVNPEPPVVTPEPPVVDPEPLVVDPDPVVPGPQPEPTVHVLSFERVTDEDGTVMDVAVVEEDGHVLHVIDTDLDGYANLIGMDINNDNLIDGSEVVPVQGQAICMADFQNAAPSGAMYAQNDMPDFVNDADVDTFMA